MLPGNIKSDVIHHMQPRVLDKVFELNIGNERISMSEKFPRIIQENVIIYFKILGTHSLTILKLSREFFFKKFVTGIGNIYERGHV